MHIENTVKKLKSNISAVISGKDEAIELLALTLICKGHMLLEDIPGTGKTVLAKAAARSVDCKFGRIQFTPDLLPSDITGINVFSRKTEDFSFRKGPVFTNILLGDEINRAAPRTQSALLECMEERQVTCDGETMPLPSPFMVIATQNPVESQGTYPLPEAQLDRFFISTALGYPEKANEKLIISGEKGVSALDSLQSVVTTDELEKCHKELSSIKISDCILDYILDIAALTRTDKRLYLGMSTRCTADLATGARALAAVRGREFVVPDDVRDILPHIAAHRIIPDDPAVRSLDEKKALIARIASEANVPKEELWKY